MLQSTKVRFDFQIQINADRFDFPAIAKALNHQHNLSEAESKVCCLILKGYSNKIIADSLGLAVNTVKNHIKTIVRKMQVTNRVGIAIGTLATLGAILIDGN